MLFKMKKKDQYDPQMFPTYWINYTSRVIQKRFDRAVRPFSFGLAYVGVASELEKSGPLLQRDLAVQYGIEQPTMAALLARMERDGLVSRKPHPRDKRASLVSLTAKGKSKLPKVKQKLVEEAQAASVGLSHAEEEMLISLLKRVAKNLDHHESVANLKT
jgi:MarR family transcriptional regulator, transcriptional regulator for hemolysin